jgi:hypothetical protein
MAVLALVTERRCKICTFPHRDQIDQLLELRSKREQDADGRNVNLDYVLEKAAELGLPNPTAENVKTHWRRHCKSVDEVTKEAVNEAVSAAFRELASEFADEGPLDADNFPDRMLRIFEIEMQRKLGEGEGLPITLDQAAKLIDVKTRRRHNDSVNLLLSGMAAGLTKALDLGPKPLEIEAEIVEEGEVVE